MRSKIMSDNMWVKLSLTFPNLITITSASGLVTQSGYFPGNSLSDSSGTFGSHNATGIDQWAQFYLKYYVAASKVKLSLVNVSTTTSQALMFTILPAPSALTQTDWDPANDGTWDMPHAITKMLPLSSGGPITRISHYMTTNKQEGKLTQQESDFGANTSGPGAPTGIWYWNVALRAIDVPSDVTVQFLCTITYYVKLYDRVSFVGVS